jgi:hypothetical protein
MMGRAVNERRTVETMARPFKILFYDNVLGDA